MSNITVDRDLNAFLGLPDDYQIDKSEAFKLYQYFIKLFPSNKNVSANTLEYYIDNHGDFINNPKNKTDYTVKAIFENLEKSDQFEVLKYIEYYKDTNGFKDIDND